MSVGEFKRNFSDALDRVRKGERIAVAYGKKKKVVAVLAPPGEGEIQGERKLGLYEGKMKVVFHDDWSVTEDELLDL